MPYMPVLYRGVDEGLLIGSSVVGAPTSHASAIAEGKQWLEPELGLNLYVCEVKNDKIVSCELIERYSSNSSNSESKRENPMSDTTLVEKWIAINPVAGDNRPTAEDLADALVTSFEAMEAIESQVPRAGNIADQISDLMHARSPGKRRSRQLVSDAEGILYEHFSSDCDPDTVQAFDGESLTVKAPWHADWIVTALDLGGEYGGGVWSFPIEAKDEVIGAIHKTFPDFTAGAVERQDNPAKKDLDVGNIEYGKKVLDIAKQKKYKLDKYEAVVSVIAAANMDRKTAQKAVRDATEPPPKKELTAADKKEREQKKIERELKKLEPYLEKMSEPSRKMVEEQIKKNVREGVPCIPMPEEGETVVAEAAENRAEEEIEEAVKEVEEEKKAKPKAKPKPKAKAKPKVTVEEAIEEAKKYTEVADSIEWERGGVKVMYSRAGKTKTVPHLGYNSNVGWATYDAEGSWPLVHKQSGIMIAERDSYRDIQDLVNYLETYMPGLGKKGIDAVAEILEKLGESKPVVDKAKPKAKAESKPKAKPKPKPKAKAKPKPKPKAKAKPKAKPKPKEEPMKEKEKKEQEDVMTEADIAYMEQSQRQAMKDALAELMGRKKNPYKGPQADLFG